jgi:acyl dehydratase
MGQLQAGMLAARLADWFGIENLREYEVRFAAPVRLGDVLRLCGEIVAIDTYDGVPVADVALRVERGDDVVVHARAKAVVCA